VSLWLLFLCVNQLRIMAGVAPTEFDNLQLVTDPSAPWEVIGAGTALLAIAMPLSLLVAWFSLLGWRKRTWAVVVATLDRGIRGQRPAVAPAPLSVV
jgi:hypothetical protein